MPSRLEQLPPELVDAISPSLSLDTIRSLRLSSRTVQQTTFPEFRRRFFSRISTCLDSYSLNRLSEMASKPELASAVRRLDIDLCLPTPSFKQDLQEVEIYKERLPLKKPPQVDNADFVLALEVLFNNINKKRHQEQVIGTFSQTLQKFGNLKELRFLSHDRYYRKDLHSDVQSGCLSIVFKALVQSGVTLEHFATSDRETESGSFTRTAILPWSNPTISVSLQKVLPEALQNIKSMDVHLWPPRNVEIPRENTFTQFLAAATNIQSLSLVFDGEGGHYSKEVIHSLSHIPPLTKLSSFNLRACSFNQDDLRFFAVHHRQFLRRMDLQCVNLHKGTWKELFEHFQHDLRELEFLNLDLLGQGRNKRRVIFDWGDFDGLFGMVMDAHSEEETRTMKEMLNEVIEHHEVHDPNQPPDNP
ncbi:hypothetical protein BDV96DRAFT_654994 [Lophiotrema nucula]|uniref:F-box domain-containing protein n=1 Tax=Lophiotrema nucula TaxID=690887 RepID=A0A6A5YGQ3_9PLEO|nr:hypothetical protein BDV96DRAFT_654994 [Lophiotrema nucula]